MVGGLLLAFSFSFLIRFRPDVHPRFMLTLWTAPFACASLSGRFHGCCIVFDLTRNVITLPVVLLLASHFSSQLLPCSTTAAESNPLLRYNWCEWSEWSRCAPVNCRNRFTFAESWYDEEGVGGDDPQQSEAEEDDPATYCVVEPTERSRKVIRTAVVQSVRSGIKRERTPMKRRHRFCKCKSISILGLLGPLGRDKCIRDTQEIYCAQCALDETIYPTQDPNKDVRPLPVCDPLADGPVQLYKIVGGVAGGVILILFMCWLARIMIKTFCRSSRVSERRQSDYGPDGRRFRSRAGQAPHRGDAPSGRQLEVAIVDPVDGGDRPGTHDELPPAYKDVVNILPSIQFAGQKPASETSQDDANLTQFFRGLHKPTSRRSNRPARPLSLDGEQVASSSQTLDPGSDQTPPPPSYEDVICTGQERDGPPLVDAAVPSCGTRTDSGCRGVTDVRTPEGPLRETASDGSGGVGGASYSTGETDVRLYLPDSLRVTANPPINHLELSAPPL
ncbi:hypothetical protein CSKR_110754 [Clonorchis sinensis]|uniref:Uncharacterized protein n=2 Tax=Clonorchis sinensis TaxID=79923 RepID=A0A419Q1V7_CLOSI|nr:hypothetical protein CSKR_110754 [Clonorchis sinensis]